MIALRSNWTTIFVRSCMIGFAAWSASESVADTGPTTPEGFQVEADPFEEFRRNRIENPEVNLLLQFPSMAVAQFLDIDLDGMVDGEDLDAWYAIVEIELLDEDDRVLTFVYDARLDVNEDGFVDQLDSELLTLGIAQTKAEQGEEWIVDGTVVSPDREIAAFDGVVVTSVWSHNDPSDENGTQNGEDGSADEPSGRNPPEPDHGESEGVFTDQEQEECPGGKVRVYEPFGTAKGYSHSWMGWGGECGGTMWHHKALATVFFHGHASSHLGCGIEGPETMMLQISRTTSTTLSLNAKAGFDSFGTSLGLTWGATISNFVMQSSALVHHSDRRYDDTMSRRSIGYNLTYTKEKSSNTGCHYWLAEIDESAKVYTMSSQASRLSLTCPGCSD